MPKLNTIINLVSIAINGGFLAAGKHRKKAAFGLACGVASLALDAYVDRKFNPNPVPSSVIALGPVPEVCQVIKAIQTPRDVADYALAANISYGHARFELTFLDVVIQDDLADILKAILGVLEELNAIPRREQTDHLYDVLAMLDREYLLVNSDIAHLVLV